MIVAYIMSKTFGTKFYNIFCSKFDSIHFLLEDKFYFIERRTILELEQNHVDAERPEK